MSVEEQVKQTEDAKGAMEAASKTQKVSPASIMWMGVTNFRSKLVMTDLPPLIGWSSFKVASAWCFVTYSTS